jgi:DNA-directed RNA polymerase subunit M/transcription elongation factor TFIIS
MKGVLFCDLCGQILKIKSVENKIVALCDCGFSKEVTSFPIYSEQMKEKEVLGNGVMNENIDINEGFFQICPKCGHDKCEIASIQPSYSDESDLTFYKCKKCNYVDRQADGSSNG